MHGSSCGHHPTRPRTTRIAPATSRRRSRAAPPEGQAAAGLAPVGRWPGLAIAATGAIALLGGPVAPAWAAGTTERVSVGAGGVQGDADSGAPTLSAGGRFVAFSSAATNLVPGDSNGEQDVFVRDRRAGRTERVSVGTGGAQGNAVSGFPVISADGRFVAFLSRATNLVPGDANGTGTIDVLVRDRRRGTTSRVNVGPGGVQADGSSFALSISADGRFVAFDSDAGNLVPDDTNGASDVFVRDRRRGRTTRVSVGAGGAQADAASSGPTISADGRRVAFGSAATNLVPGDTNGADDVFVRDRPNGQTERVSVGPGGAQGDAGSFRPAIAARGRLVAFFSAAANLVPGDTNGLDDVFVRDRRAEVTRRASVGSRGVQADAGGIFLALSPDGRFVGFDSAATNLVPGDTNGASDVFLRDRRTRRTERVSVGSGGFQGDADSFGVAVSAGGRFVAFSSGATNLVPGSDANGREDIFVRDRRTGRTERVSTNTAGVQADSLSLGPKLSASGRFVAFFSSATNLVPGDTNGEGDVFVHDRRTGRTERVSVGAGEVQGNGTSGFPAISPGGRYVAFDSFATNLVPKDTNGVTDAYLRDRETGRTELVSVGLGGASGDQPSGAGAVSASGRFVAFTSLANDLVPGDTNAASDVFVRDRRARRTERVSVGPGGAQGDAASGGPAISDDGRYVAFLSEASDLVPDDTNGVTDVFVRDRKTGRTRRVSVGPAGAQANDLSPYLALAPGGHFVAFASAASNLVRGDTNGASDIFVHNLLRGQTTRVSLRRGGGQAAGGGTGSISPAIAAGGRVVAFTSDANDLVPGDTNNRFDVFVRER